MSAGTHATLNEDFRGFFQAQLAKFKDITTEY